MVNKFFYIKGGSETYYFALKNLLQEKGHEVIDFSMKNEKNYNSPYSDYFVSDVDYNGKMTAKLKLKAAFNIIYSKEAKDRFEKLVIATSPDVVHLHIFQHQLSPSILDVCKKYKIPVVYTAHDLKMLCLNYVMLANGEICEKCKKGHYISCLKQKCVKDSLAKSLINVCEGYLHKWRKSYDAIHKIITPSRFYRDKFLEFGIDAHRVIHLTNFLGREKPVVGVRSDKEQYFLYFGRMSREKGINTLVKAFSIYAKNTSEYVKLYIVGTGPCEGEIKQLIEQLQSSNIMMLGFKSGQELIDIVGNARAVVLPSEWYENGPYTAIEALQCGRPIIGSELGGIPELVDGNGKIFTHGDEKELSRVLNEFPYPDSEDYRNMCKRSEEIFDLKYTAESHYRELINIYGDVIRQN